ncbi:MAG TPA: hypothetical protein VFO07_10265, partial [Roseiflexaceae bacterium]|nr:hypothetical protein [Roseiflexaceae bacterium]
MSDSDSRRRSSPPPHPAKREDVKGGDRRARFEARQQPNPPAPRPLSKLIDLDEPPELRPRAVRNAAVQTTVRQPAQRVEVGRPAAEPRNPAASVAADHERARLMSARSLPARPYYPIEAPRRSIFEFFSGNPLLLMLVGAACLMIFLLASAPARRTFGNLLDQQAITPTQVHEAQRIFAP